MTCSFQMYTSSFKVQNWLGQRLIVSLGYILSAVIVKLGDVFVEVSCKDLDFSRLLWLICLEVQHRLGLNSV